ncbi:hypothetical protein CS542_09725 [Pedobacter sp. IW39]|nr:hypothetical protein CS542_09725 [Pedobacter sp. IW39]
MVIFHFMRCTWIPVMWANQELFEIAFREMKGVAGFRQIILMPMDRLWDASLQLESDGKVKI